MFPEAVECYQRASKQLMNVEKIVRERSIKSETPPMWSALGHNTKDPSYYKKAIELSNAKISSAIVALRKNYFDIGNPTSAIKPIKSGQGPEEGKAWANIAIIHLRKQERAKGYPALEEEAWKQNRNNWRVWRSKIFNCLDLL